MSLILRSGPSGRVSKDARRQCKPLVRTTAGQGWQRRIVSANQRFLLFAPPTLDLPFCGDGVFDALEDFVKN